MAVLLREMVAIAIRASGAPWLIRNVWARNKVTIVVYHDPNPELFAEQMAFVARRHKFIPLADLVDALYRRDWSAIPPYALVVTIDDGHRGNYELLPIFKRFGIRPTINLCSRIAGTLRHFWFREVPYEQAIHLQTLPHAEKLAILEKTYGHTPQQEYPESSRQALSDSEIAEMSPYVDFQSHTCLHPILTAINDSECRFEIEQSKLDVEEKVGRPCQHFCFPDGDYTQRELDIVKAAGYRSARTVDLGWNDLKTDPFRLKVTGITDDASVNMVAAQLSGIPTWMRRASLGRFDGRHLTLTFDQPYR